MSDDKFYFIAIMVFMAVMFAVFAIALVISA